MKLLSYADLRDKGIKYSKVHLWRLVKEGKFPKPVQVGKGARLTWIDTEIDALLAARIAARDQAESA